MEPQRKGFEPIPLPDQLTHINTGSVLVSLDKLHTKHETKSVEHIKTPSRFQKFKEKMAHIVDFSVLKESIFVVYLISWFMMCMGAIVPHTFLLMRTAVHGINKEHGAVILSMLGVFDFIGRLIFGVLGNRVNINRIYFVGGATIACGVINASFTFATTFAGLFCYMALYGLSIGKFA